MKKQTVERKNDIGNGVKKAVFAVIGIVLQILWIYITLFRLGTKYSWIHEAVLVAEIILVLYLYAEHKTASIKLPWIILIMGLPPLGVFLYLMMGMNSGTRRMRERYTALDFKLFPYLEQDRSVFRRLSEKSLRAANEARYVRDFARYPVYGNTDVTFYDDAAKGYAAQLKELEKAERFIFMEYHAIEAGESFKPLHDVMKRKASEGVEVRLFYDYVGSMGFIGNSFVDRMEADGIHCRVFNPVTPLVNLFLNNRDHRKITVIDGKVGFTGGYNLADEYFHVTEPYGHWLDTGLRLEGDAVRSLTVTFLENWNAIRDDDHDDEDVSMWLPEYDYTAKEQDGFIQPFGDSPLDDEHVGEIVYMNILRNAKRYAWFITPYLIITDEMINSFALAAKSGVDVRIITPGIPDKKLVYELTRSYYAPLVRNGVRVYEYTPGFCHAKQCVSDDTTAFCGTINLDFRSLYHHFENGALFMDYKAVHEMKEQFEGLFPVCREVTEEYRTGRSKFLRLRQLILRLAAPLM